MRALNFALTISALGLVVSTLAACSGSSSAGGGGSTGTPLTISGGFSNATFVPLMQDNGLFTPMAATDYTMICNMLVDPYSSGSSALAADGSFSLTVAGAAGNPIGCMLTKAGKIAAVIEFVATSSSFSGASGGSAYMPNGDSTSLTFPTNIVITDGVAAVPTTGVSQNGTTAPTLAWTDPTGTWAITGACQNGINRETGQFESQCFGQQDADEIPSSVYLKQVTATKTGEPTKNGLAIWKDAAARTACGNVEGPVDLNGFTDVGGWSDTFSGHSTLDFSSGGIAGTAAKAIAPTFGGNQSVCNATVPQPGTTTCAANIWTGTGANWGMTDAACKLYCVTMALGNGGDDSTNFNYGSDACKMRYRVRWENLREFATDKNYGQGSSATGAFNSGSCDSGFDGCKSGATVLIHADERGPKDRFMFGELFMNGPVGTIIQKEYNKNNYPAAGNTSMIECGGTHVEKFTMVQQSATKATVTVEHTFVTEVTNPSGCATNQDFLRNSSDESTMTLTLVKQ